MTWSSYWAFLAFAVVLILVPGPDFVVVTRNTLVNGRRSGAWSAAGVTCSNIVQGAAAAAGLGAVVLRVEPLFQVIRWAGFGYLAFLGIRAVRSAVRGRYPAMDEEGTQRARDVAVDGWRQGFLSNITNPKVLVFYIAVLPQFLPQGAGIPVVLLWVLSHALLGLIYLLALTVWLHRVRRWLARRSVRRTLDAATGAALLAFSCRIATEHP